MSHSAFGPASIATVKRGDNLKIAVYGSGFEITTSAIALEDAMIGSSVRVKSLTDGSIFRVTVISGGFAELRD
jgi:flagella basal body P-ring formation protein FlgA